MTDKKELQEMMEQTFRKVLAEATAPVSTMSMSEVCDFLHLTRPAIYRRVDAGLLTPKHVGKRLLFDRKEVEAIVK